MIIDKKIKTRGVTLIELLVAISIFSIFIAAISGLYISAIRAQQKILATHELLNQADYILEYIGRAVRMAVKDGTPTCLVEAGVPDPGANYWVDPEAGDPYMTEGLGIRFLESTEESGNICEEFYLDAGTLKSKRSTDNTAGNFGPAVPLLPSNTTVLYFQVKISGDYPANKPPDPNLQPKVTISLGLLGKNTSLGQPTVQIQTTISQRKLDVEE